MEKKRMRDGIERLPVDAWQRMAVDLDPGRVTALREASRDGREWARAAATHRGVGDWSPNSRAATRNRIANRETVYGTSEFRLRRVPDNTPASELPREVTHITFGD